MMEEKHLLAYHSSRRRKKVCGIGEAVLDTGCSDATMTLGRWNVVKQELALRNVHWSYVEGPLKYFKIADGTKIKTLYLVSIPVPVLGEVVFSVLDTGENTQYALTPPVVGRKAFEGMEAYIATHEKVLLTQYGDIPLGAPLIPMRVESTEFLSS